MKDQRFRVFLAHDASELKETAVDISFELVKHQCIPMGIGLNPEVGNNHWDIIRAMIDESDAIFLLVGDSYGDLSPSGVSYVHMAYIYATTQKKPIFPFCLKTAQTKSSVNAHLEEFRKLLNAHNVRSWTVEADLRKQMLMAIRKLKSTHDLGLVPVSNDVAPGLQVQIGQPAKVPVPNQLTEIKALKRELEEAKKALATSPSSLSMSRVKNTSVMVSYSAKVFNGGNFKTISQTWNMTWDSVFLAVAPHMLKPISEEKMRLVISAALATDVQAPIKQQYPDSHAVADIRLTNDSMNRIRIYLRGQDLIREIMQGRDIRWMLTELGDQHLTELYTKQPLVNSMNS